MLWTAETGAWSVVAGNSWGAISAVGTSELSFGSAPLSGDCWPGEVESTGAVNVGASDSSTKASAPGGAPKALAAVAEGSPIARPGSGEPSWRDDAMSMAFESETEARTKRTAKRATAQTTSDATGAKCFGLMTKASTLRA